MKPSVDRDLWLTVTCRRWFVSFNKSTVSWEMLIFGWEEKEGDRAIHGNSMHFPLNFSAILKLLLKIKLTILNKMVRMVNFICTLYHGIKKIQKKKLSGEEK